MIDARIEAPRRMSLVTRALKDLGDKDLSRVLSRALTLATTPLKEAAKREAGIRLPHRGGLAARVAATKFATSRAGTRRNPGVTIRAKGMKSLMSMDQGQVRHPVYGNRDVWVSQAVTPGWFSDPMEAGADEAARAINGAMDLVAIEVARRLDSV